MLDGKVLLLREKLIAEGNLLLLVLLVLLLRRVVLVPLALELVLLLQGQHVRVLHHVRHFHVGVLWIEKLLRRKDLILRKKLRRHILMTARQSLVLSMLLRHLVEDLTLSISLLDHPWVHLHMMEELLLLRAWRHAVALREEEGLGGVLLDVGHVPWHGLLVAEDRRGIVRSVGMVRNERSSVFRLIEFLRTLRTKHGKVLIHVINCIIFRGSCRHYEVLE